tara:strand:+ start:7004 stop:7693 length:690 start_codon:yes stop_codon:yes gene_type:complete
LIPRIFGEHLFGTRWREFWITEIWWGLISREREFLGSDPGVRRKIEGGSLSKPTLVDIPVLIRVCPVISVFRLSVVWRRPRAWRRTLRGFSDCASCWIWKSPSFPLINTSKPRVVLRVTQWINDHRLTELIHESPTGIVVRIVWIEKPPFFFFLIPDMIRCRWLTFTPRVYFTLTTMMDPTTTLGRWAPLDNPVPRGTRTSSIPNDIDVIALWGIQLRVTGVIFKEPPG